ncbi:hypothetical protein BV25DRAFT_916937 [Artomyces pyxidatus]|uniref:Uncharacterized protein n=1 Tax=Artomyces pyxidatus TaxID=48021 RepID=A0ACB8SW18_9AGAM|nr:hypothetical protein BV25DRAFT_916937 [Artomyces pyxidatus]
MVALHPLLTYLRLLYSDKLCSKYCQFDMGAIKSISERRSGVRPIGRLSRSDYGAFKRVDWQLNLQPTILSHTCGIQQTRLRAISMIQGTTHSESPPEHPRPTPPPDEDEEAISSSGLPLSTEVWLRDGNVVVMCSGMLAFRAHRSVLEEHSPVFRRKLEETVYRTEANCSFLELTEDSPEYMERMLKRLFNRGYDRHPKDIKLETQAGVLWLALKYDIRVIRDEILDHLKVLFPSNIDQYRSDQRIRLLPDDLNPLTGVDIALNFNIPAILPAALYMSSRWDLRYIQQDAGVSGGVIVHQSTRDAIVRFKDRLRTAIGRWLIDDGWSGTALLCQWQAETSIPCPGLHSTIAQRGEEAYRELTIDIFGDYVAHWHKSLCPEYVSPCKLCLLGWMEKEAVCQQSIWNILPSIAAHATGDKRFQLHDWQEVCQAQELLETQQGLWNSETIS